LLLAVASSVPILLPAGLRLRGFLCFARIPALPEHLLIHALPCPLSSLSNSAQQVPSDGRVGIALHASRTTFQNMGTEAASILALRVCRSGETHYLARRFFLTRCRNVRSLGKHTSPGIWLGSSLPQDHSHRVSSSAPVGCFRMRARA
jgi:hypothetical protein